MSASEGEVFIAVIGGGDCSSEEATLAEAVGRELAKKGATLICGGLGGVMEAACRGAWLERGRTIGILPGNSPEEANPYVGIPIVTGMGEARNVVIVKSSHAVIAINGEFGTLSEIGHALRNNTPVVGLNTWSLFKGGQRDKSILEAHSPLDAVEKALKAARP